MKRRAFLSLISALSITGLAGPLRPAAATAETSVSGPFIHENLAVYLVHGKSAAGPIPLTLEEALAKGAVEVRETGSVNALEIENLGDSEVFVQGGDIVKGGRQDRVLAVSLLLAPKSGKMPISAFCVEHGRWSKRGQESDAKFAAVNQMLPSREAKLAMRSAGIAPAAGASGVPAQPSAQTGRLAGRPNGRIDSNHAGIGTASAQSEVWAKVGEIQDKLGANLGAAVRSEASESSLQLSLENDGLAKAQKDYVEALSPRALEGDDVIGYVFAVNGRINSADVYASNGLFRKMLPRVLKASATEAIAKKEELPKAIEPTSNAVEAFLNEATKAEPQPAATPPIKGLEVESRKSKAALQSETRRAGGDLVHRNVLAY